MLCVATVLDEDAELDVLDVDEDELAELDELLALDELTTLEELDELVGGGVEPPPPPPHAVNIKEKTMDAIGKARVD
jgi:hypothetical protein